MPEDLRFTGDWPPRQYLEQFSNWTDALDEEGEDDQDETTLKPNDEQQFIDEDTIFTVGDATFADGSRHLAVIQVYDGSAEMVDVFAGDLPWRLQKVLPGGEWVPFIQKWLPDAERMPTVSLTDDRIFPLQIVTRLPNSLEGKPIQLQIEPGGIEREVQ